MNLPENRTCILPDDFRLSLPAATLPCMWAVSRVGYIDTINKPTGSGKWLLLDRIMTQYETLHDSSM
jgi:hypothetical protein